MSDSGKTPLQRIPVIMPIVVLIAALYAGWIFYSRWNAAHEAKRAAAAQEVERIRKEVELNGGSELKITALYASSGVVRRGQALQLCYGVVNAKNVAFDPPIPDVWPSMSRCVDVAPKKSTTYTLTADDGAGHSEKAQLSIEVK